MPSVTFFIDVAFEQAQQRMHFGTGAGEPDRMERAGREFFERVREGYLAIAKDDPDRMVVIDGARERVAIHDDILTVLRSRTSLPL